MAEQRCIRDENTETVSETIDSDYVKDLRRGTYLYAVTRSRHNESEGGDDYAQQEARMSTQNTQNFRNAQVRDTPDDLA